MNRRCRVFRRYECRRKRRRHRSCRRIRLGSEIGRQTRIISICAQVSYSSCRSLFACTPQRRSSNGYQNSSLSDKKRASGLTGGREPPMPRSNVLKLRIYPSNGQGFGCALCGAKLKYHVILSNELGPSPARSGPSTTTKMKILIVRSEIDCGLSITPISVVTSARFLFYLIIRSKNLAAYV